jgi:hypothetical protein
MKMRIEIGKIKLKYALKANERGIDQCGNTAGLKKCIYFCQNITCASFSNSNYS